MSSLDLDIHRYSISDMEQLFKLKKNKNYTGSEIELRETEIRTQLLSSGHIDKRLKRDLITFLTNVKNHLINVKCSKDKIKPLTSLNVPPLDSSNYPVFENPIKTPPVPVYNPLINTNKLDNENEQKISIPNIRTNEIISSSKTHFSPSGPLP